MRKTFIILCIWSIIVGCSQEQKEEDTPSKEKEEWKLVWEDDFNHDDIFATGIWSKIWDALLPKPTANYKLIISICCSFTNLLVIIMALIVRWKKPTKREKYALLA